jgi:outer membrane protein assembly factor BamB
VLASIVFDSEGRAFVADMAGFIRAFSRSGELQWEAKLAAGVSATPAVHSAHPRLFVGTHDGSVAAFDTLQGTRLWDTTLLTRADPRILSNLLYFAAADGIVVSSWGGRFHLLDAQTGTSRASWDAGISPSSSAAASAERLYCLRAVEKRGVEFVQVDASGTETVLHRTEPDSRGPRRTLVAAAPVVDPERSMVYFAVNREKSCELKAWSLQSRELAWTCPLPHSVQATPALRRDGVILVPDLAGIVHGIGPDGAPRFRYSTGSEYLLAGGVTEAEGTCFIGDPLGVVHQIDEGGSGKRIFEAPRAIQARPSFDAQGNLYVPATGRAVYVFAKKAG